VKAAAKAKWRENRRENNGEMAKTSSKNENEKSKENENQLAYRSVAAA
jgi:hypothetical protein